VNGFAAVDVVDRQWPDSMGDPQNDPILFGGWSMGQFGPFAFPGGLRRATQQCWSWPEGKSLAAAHQAFIRVRMSYVFGGAEDAPLFPENYDPVHELSFVTRLTSVLVGLPGNVCYFNPNGEVLRHPAEVVERLKASEEGSVPPLDLWSNVRLFNVNDGWLLMDTVGNSQLDHLGLSAPFPDFEVCIPPDKSDDLASIDPFLRNVTLYALNSGAVFRDGDTINGPFGMNWRALVRKRGLINPPRACVRFFPEDDSAPPEILCQDHEHPVGG
jgi:hypothetical protein